ncbi:hypothetical protein SAMN02745121_01638 [Nannocystis exedens]|uniref:Uncharacterized protein n=1 Tax=Nannocystis exedens TaxID=54 RepID=A0A1I1V940_9BACT|nr:hypothetical protein [Nannocystis exedens]PCC72461.1 hypothetical protein NAEX_05541 [Nannocystis exedens]SFD79571.1 hypothetical protein SAMN02745121_01638 [Nannocystis exedens]
MRTIDLRGVSLIALLVSAAPGCLTAEGVVRKSVPAALDETVGFLEDPQAQQRIQKLLQDPQIQEASRELTESLVEGALDGLTDEQRQAALRDMTTRYLDAVAKAAGTSLKEQISPALAATVRQTLDTALSPRTRREASAMVDDLTRTTVTALTQSAGKGLTEDLGPALRQVLEEDLGPGLKKMVRADLAPALRDAVRDELVPVVGIVSREASKQLVLGAADALAELEVKRDLGQLEESMWTRLDHMLHRGIQISQIIAWVLGLALAVVIGLVVRGTVLRRRIEADRARSERLLLSLVDELHRGCDKPDVEELLSQIRTRVPDLDDRHYMEELARRASGPRLRRDRPRRRL